MTAPAVRPHIAARKGTGIGFAHCNSRTFDLNEELALGTLP